MSKKYTWIIALFMVMAAVFMGCQESPKDKGEEEKIPEGWVETEIFKLSALIKDIPNGNIIVTDDKDANEYLFFDDSFIQAVGNSAQHKYEIIERGGKKALKITTLIFWTGLDVKNSKVKFRAGDKVNINFEHNPGPSGEPIDFWLNTIHSGQSAAGGWSYKTATNGSAREDEITLTSADVQNINSNSGSQPKTLRVRSSRENSEIILYELKISGYRPKDGSDPCQCTNEDCVCDCFGECGPDCPACLPDCDCGCFKNGCTLCTCESGACCAACITKCGCILEETLGDFLIVKNIPELTAQLSTPIQEGIVVSPTGPLRYASWIGDNVKPVWVKNNGGLSIKVSGADGNNGLVVQYDMNVNDKIKLTGSVVVNGPGQDSRMLFVNGNTGAWDDLSDKFFFGQHAAGTHAFEFTATINAGTADRDAVRIQVGNMDATVSHFIIDSIEITR